MQPSWTCTTQNDHQCLLLLRCASGGADVESLRDLRDLFAQGYNCISKHMGKHILSLQP